MKRIVKTLTWRILGSTSTFIISYIITGQLVISSGITIFQMIANTLLYYVHETVWDKIKWNS